MLVQVVDVLEDGELSRHDDVVDRAEVLGVFGEADTAGVGDYGDGESGDGGKGLVKCLFVWD